MRFKPVKPSKDCCTTDITIDQYNNILYWLDNKSIDEVIIGLEELKKTLTSEQVKIAYFNWERGFEDNDALYLEYEDDLKYQEALKRYHENMEEWNDYNEARRITVEQYDRLSDEKKKRIWEIMEE
jgi:DNA-directed RNA polymerase subunit L